MQCLLIRHCCLRCVLQELMQQASWNLCPQDIQYNADCYDDPDNKFASISGSLTKYMPDLPDGDWSLVLKKDIFQKVCMFAAVAAAEGSQHAG